MRIGFTGSQGSGKTSVAKALVKKFPTYDFVPSSARAASAAGYKVNRDADPLSQLLVTAARVADEDYAARYNRDTVSDRTPLDSLAYAVYQQYNKWGMRSDDYYMLVTTKFVMGHMQKYDVIYYFPVLWTPKADDVRDGDVEYQKTIDIIIQRLLAHYNVPYTEMPGGNVTERLDFICGKNRLTHHTH